VKTGFTIDLAKLVLRLLITIVVFLITPFANAQLCNGSLGDPVVNITFGAAGSGNGGFVPTGAYTYTSSSCPNDGYYTVTNSTSGCFGGTWLTVNSDHTGNGAFMLVNASYTPGDFFVDTVKDLCPNTTYEFAAWIVNVMARSGIKPNITFSIETSAGTILQQYSTGDIPETFTASWRQYGFFFTTPATNPVIVLRMTNNAPGGIGNDLGLDDITFRPCGAGVISAAIQGNSDTVNICQGNTNSYTFNGTVSSAYASPVNQWQLSKDSGKIWQDIAGANGITYTRQPITTAGAFWYRLTVTDRTTAGISSCRISSNIVAVNVHASPAVNAGPDKIVFAGDSVTLDGTVIGESASYYWDPPNYLNNNNLLTPSASPPADMQYTLFASSAYGCPGNTDAVFVKVVAGIFVPNAFTPNNDGKNDRWRIPFLDPQFGGVVNVYNRLGELVYHTEAAVVDWDGTFKGMSQSAGTYVYHIRFKNIRHADMKGTFILIR
jgi:gliding motility-associated-like protein